jgi:D-amino peptidase
MEESLKGKKFYIGVDCEGVACVVGEPGIGLGNGEQYRFAINQAAKEANAAAKALLELGAEKVLVWDNHGTGCNFDYRMLDERVEIVLGSGKHGRFPLLDESFSGVLMIGYHARENTADAVLAHTYSSKMYQYYKVDGREMGEMEIDGAIASRKGAPVIFCSSDEAGIKQAKEAFPWAETVVTKKGLSWTSAISKHPDAVCKEISQAVRRAVGQLDHMKYFEVPSPVMVEIRYKRMEDAANAMLIDWKGEAFMRPDAFTRCGMLETLEKLF